MKGSALKFFSSFLPNRTHQVWLGNSVSNVERVISGVVEGSVLGPNLFNVVEDSLHRRIQLPHVGYADD